MAKEFAKRFYNGRAWREGRAAYIDSVTQRLGGPYCERCFARGVIKPGYIVHHKHKLEPGNIDDQRVTLDPNNYEYVCLECHNADELGEHSGSGPKLKPRRCKYDAEGRVLPP
jgi:5-methylcytosine-specific restriction protein A